MTRLLERILQINAPPVGGMPSWQCKQCGQVNGMATFDCARCMAVRA